MARRFVLALLIFAAIIAWRTVRIGDLGVADSLVARRHSGRTFNSSLWRSGDANTRGKMLADLAHTHQLVGVQASTIINLLGPSECYASYDDAPCYKIAFDGTKHQLQFSVNHSDKPGRVIDVSLGQ
jgi:hypothetical protein